MHSARWLLGGGSGEHGVAGPDGWAWWSSGGQGMFMRYAMPMPMVSLSSQSPHVQYVHTSPARDHNPAPSQHNNTLLNDVLYIAPSNTMFGRMKCHQGTLQLLLKHNQQLLNFVLVLFLFRPWGAAFPVAAGIPCVGVLPLPGLGGIGSSRSGVAAGSWAASGLDEGLAGLQSRNAVHQQLDD
ncbi:hypothetical protein E2C01_022685 [Portunus trituberculatus]|uniref:Uncharacterized protein n=1 Tax=Portunus trituberculatus TaxID=210409 RepID=A0A5B7E8L0_PORTR|nr:hypothetical protein [Portunus trituberculatus]